MKNFNFLFFIFLLFAASCVKKECQIDGSYQFEIPATLSPAIVTYKIGDTISINSRFSDQVYDAKTDKFYSLTDFKFYPIFEVNEISDSTLDEAALNNFEVIIDTIKYDFTEFIFSSGSIVYDGQFLYKNGEYSLEYKIIPKAAGFYSFFQGTLVGDIGEEQDFPEKCRNININVRTILNNGADNNLDLARNSPNEWYNTRIFHKPEERFTYLGGYIFYVEE